MSCNCHYGLLIVYLLLRGVHNSDTLDKRTHGRLSRLQACYTYTIIAKFVDFSDNYLLSRITMGFVSDDGSKTFLLGAGLQTVTVC